MKKLIVALLLSMALCRPAFAQNSYTFSLDNGQGGLIHCGNDGQVIFSVPKQATVSRIDVITQNAGFRSIIRFESFNPSPIQPGVTKRLWFEHFAPGTYGSSPYYSTPETVQQWTAPYPLIADGIFDWSGTGGVESTEMIRAPRDLKSITDPAYLAYFVGSGTAQPSARCYNNIVTTDAGGNYVLSVLEHGKATVQFVLYP